MGPPGGRGRENGEMAASAGGGKQAQPAGASYIGKKISLTSKSEIRYEGTLYQIDPKASTVSLENVRSFGSEGRPRDGPPVPASNEMYSYIVFRASDIKELKFLAPAPAKPAQPQMPADPAIVDSGYGQKPGSRSPPQETRPPQAAPRYNYPSPSANQKSAAEPQRAPTAVEQEGKHQAQGEQGPVDSQEAGGARQKPAAPVTTRPTRGPTIPTMERRAPMETREPGPARGWGPPPTAATRSQYAGGNRSQTSSQPPEGERRAEPEKRSPWDSRRDQAGAWGKPVETTAEPSMGAWGAKKASETAAQKEAEVSEDIPAVSKDVPAPEPVQTRADNPAPALVKAGGERGWERGDPRSQSRHSYQTHAHYRGRQDNRGQGKSRIVVPSEDFDFEAMNEKFDKVGVAEDGEVAEEIPKYDKKYDASKSFFDDLVSERASGEPRNKEFERKNMETFGEQAAIKRYGNRGGRRSMGYRGGYHSRSSEYRNSGNRGYQRKDGWNNQVPSNVDSRPQQTSSKENQQVTWGT
uniref:FFD box profile domain-containing protein n=1 Tax=Rhodosorus marinus TaxID=101924 RepID=A0A7S2ZZ72_9RHOD